MCVLVTLLAVILVAVKSELEPTLTLPMSHQKISHQTANTYHHLRHSTAEDGSQTYPLIPATSIFTIHLVVNGFDYHLSIDTGSSDFFIKGEGTTGQPLRKFSCPSCISDNQYVSIAYLDGQLDTYLYQARVSLGNHTFKEQILVAYNSNNSGNFKRIGGILGVSFQQISRNPHPNFINTLIQQGIISKYRFGLKLNFRDKNSSFITFGGIDTSYIDPMQTLAYYPIMTEHFHYKVATSKFYFGGREFDIQVALVDSGNTCVSISADHTDEMLEEMNQGGNNCEFQKENGNNQFKLLMCNITNFDVLPVLKIVMPDGKELSWQKQYYIDKCRYHTKTHPRTYLCQTFIENVANSESLFLGAAFMLKYYAAFDLGSKQIGFAKNTDNPTIQKTLAKALPLNPKQTDD